MKIRRLLLIMLMFVAACAADDGTTTPEVTETMPEWLESVYPAPGATISVPDAVEVEHNLVRGPDEDIRLVVDDVDVSTYAVFDAALMRYESGAGPVTLGTGEHTATVQRVLLLEEETQFEVVDSFTWQFRTG